MWFTTDTPPPAYLRQTIWLSLCHSVRRRRPLNLFKTLISSFVSDTEIPVPCRQSKTRSPKQGPRCWTRRQSSLTQHWHRGLLCGSCPEHGRPAAHTQPRLAPQGWQGTGGRLCKRDIPWLTCHPKFGFSRKGCRPSCRAGMFFFNYCYVWGFCLFACFFHCFQQALNIENSLWGGTTQVGRWRCGNTSPDSTARSSKVGRGLLAAGPPRCVLHQAETTSLQSAPKAKVWNRGALPWAGTCFWAMTWVFPYVKETLRHTTAFCAFTSHTNIKTWEFNVTFHIL